MLGNASLDWRGTKKGMVTCSAGKKEPGWKVDGCRISSGRGEVVDLIAKQIQVQCIYSLISCPNYLAQFHPKGHTSDCCFCMLYS